MLTKQIRHTLKLAQTTLQAIHLITGLFHTVLPGVGLVPGHIVNYMITGHNHKRRQTYA